ncbi:hypothetical protein F2Q70_00038700 [Brassica cretica]|uniref:Replication protein A 70 kDa DNA-binding subunit B/D first OB fold domain-containing protein n=1 Tax=Brassica cretica TaxID=69181 RepID=A0A8S9K549_BRACR|nr:hypothetical protein F2Q70_00038700 [Brassica cretica]
MTHCNRLSEVSYNNEITSWRFRVKIHKIYPFYSYVTGSGPHWTYILADEDGTKMEMTICGGYEDRFRGLEKQEGKWVEIFRVDVHRAYPGFQATKSRFTLNATRYTQVHIIDPLNNRLYMDFKNICEISHMNHRDRNYPVDTMGVVFNTESHFDDPARPKMVFYIRDNIRIKCVATGDHAYAFRDGLENMGGRGQVIVVLKMWRVWSFFSSIRFCRRLRSSDSLYYAVTLMFIDMGR